MSIERRVAVVTGSGQGIGAGCARSLAQAGFSVVLMSPSERSRNLARELGGVGLRGSVLDDADLNRLVELAIDSYGRIDAVVNNMGHGGSLPGPIERTTYDPRSERPLLEIEDRVWHESLDMYLMNVVRMARLVTPVMTRAGGGAIVNISSMNALEPRAMYPMSVLRGALHGFTKLYADRYARHGIRMNNLLPGFVQTGNVSLSADAQDSIPMGRIATLEEIGAACVFLCSAASSYMMGQQVLVDGGLNRAVR
jgi:NAD(P)-dependent dehydrogenase (short-subunit alcohol dehydrogenase family)